MFPKSEQKSKLTCFRTVEPPASPPNSERAPVELQRSFGVAGLIVLPFAWTPSPMACRLKWERQIFIFAGVTKSFCPVSAPAAFTMLLHPAGVGLAQTTRTADQSG